MGKSRASLNDDVGLLVVALEDPVITRRRDTRCAPVEAQPLADFVGQLVAVKECGGDEVALM